MGPAHCRAPNGDERTERYALNARVFADMAGLCADKRIAGAHRVDEPSPYHATVELSYLVFARFSWEPALTWQQFLAEDVALLLGGIDAAHEFVNLAEEMNAHQVLPLDRLQALRRAAMAHRDDDDAGRRWLALEDQVARSIYMGA